MNTKKVTLSLFDNSTELDSTITLNVGKQTISQRYFTNQLPTPYQVEMAIIEIEDAIALIKSDWDTLTKANSITVVADKESFSDILTFAKVTDSLTSEQFEFAFNRLADVIAGSPKRENEFPDSVEFISSMLILREVMHHLMIPKIDFCG